MLEPVLRNPWVRAGALLLALIAVGLLTLSLSYVLAPLFLAFIVAYVLDPVADFLEKLKIGRGMAVGLLAFLGVCGALSVPLILAPSIISEADNLIRASADKEETQGPVSSRITLFLDKVMDKLPSDRLCEIMGWGDPEAPDFSAREEIMRRLGSYVKDSAISFIRGLSASTENSATGAGVSIGGFLRSIGAWLVAMVVFLGNFALFAVVAVYLLHGYDDIVAKADELIPAKYHDKTVSIMKKIDMQLRAFLRGQFAVCSCLGGMYAIGMIICGTPFWLFLAVLGGAAAIVPYVGVAATAISAILLTVLRHGLDWHVIGILITFVIAQNIEGNFLTPNIVGKQVGLNPVWVILAIMVFGSSLGFLGLLLAVPIAAVLKVLVEEGVNYYKQSPLIKPGGLAKMAEEIKGASKEEGGEV